MSHYKEVCQYGKVHSQCRCPDPNKTVKNVTCNMPDSHKMSGESNTPKVGYPLSGDTSNPKPPLVGPAAGAAPSEPEPPVAKYRYTLVVTGNSHDEILDEIFMQTRGGYLLDSDHYKRDEFRVYGGNKTTTLEHANPEMTTERYKADLETWWLNRKKAKEESDVREQRT